MSGILTYVSFPEIFSGHSEQSYFVFFFHLDGHTSSSLTRFKTPHTCQAWQMEVLTPSPKSGSAHVWEMTTTDMLMTLTFFVIRYMHSMAYFWWTDWDRSIFALKTIGTFISQQVATNIKCLLSRPTYEYIYWWKQTLQQV